MYLVQELCRGGELLDHILKAKHFSEREASAIMLKLAHILSYLHSNQVCPYEFIIDSFQKLLQRPNIKTIKFVDCPSRPKTFKYHVCKAKYNRSRRSPFDWLWIRQIIEIRNGHAYDALLYCTICGSGSLKTTSLRFVGRCVVTWSSFVRNAWRRNSIHNSSKRWTIKNTATHRRRTYFDDWASMGQSFGVGQRFGSKVSWLNFDSTQTTKKASFYFPFFAWKVS